MKLAGLLQHPDPIIINHTIRWGHSMGTGPEGLCGLGTGWAVSPGLGVPHRVRAGSVPRAGGLCRVGSVPRPEGSGGFEVSGLKDQHKSPGRGKTIKFEGSWGTGIAGGPSTPQPGGAQPVSPTPFPQCGPQ